MPEVELSWRSQSCKSRLELTGFDAALLYHQASCARACRSSALTLTFERPKMAPWSVANLGLRLYRSFVTVRQSRDEHLKAMASPPPTPPSPPPSMLAGWESSIYAFPWPPPYALAPLTEFWGHRHRTTTCAWRALEAYLYDWPAMGEEQ